MGGYIQNTVEELNSGLPRTNSDRCRVNDLHRGAPQFKSIVLDHLSPPTTLFPSNARPLPHLKEKRPGDRTRFVRRVGQTHLVASSFHDTHLPEATSFPGLFPTFEGKALGTRLLPEDHGTSNRSLSCLHGLIFHSRPRDILWRNFILSFLIIHSHTCDYYNIWKPKFSRVSSRGLQWKENRPSQDVYCIQQNQV